MEDFEYNIVEPGYYELILEAHADEFTCPSKDTLIMIFDSLDLKFSVDSIINCEGYVFSPYDYIVNNISPSVSFNWEIINIDNNIFDSSSSQNPTFTMNEPGLFDLNVHLFSGINDCDTSILFEDFIKIIETPFIDLSLSVNESNSCLDDETGTINKTIKSTFDISDSSVTDYNWEISPSNGINIISSSLDSIEYSFSEPGSYIISYNISVEGSECNYFEEIEVIIGATASINTSSYICTGKEFQLFSYPNTVLGNNVSFIWSSLDTNLAIASLTSNPTSISTNQAGNYQIQLDVSNEFGCSTKVNKTIQAYDMDASFSSNISAEQCRPAIIELQSLNNSFINNYKWNINETSYVGDISTTTYSSFSPNFETVFDEVASYSIELIINSIHGCSDTMVIDNYIEVISPLPYFTLDPLVSCDTVYLNIIDSSNFTDSYFMDYGKWL